MYNKLMDSKIIKKLLAYAKEHEILDLAITQRDGYHILYGENSLAKHKLKLPAKLETELGDAYRRLLALAPNDLISGAYIKDQGLAYRLSIIPDGSGEKIIISAVTKTKKLMPLSHLGLGRNERQLIERFLKKRRGLIIVGSGDNQGKTTTLYSLLEKIDQDKHSCYSLEKYPELKLDGISQVITKPDKRLEGLERILKSDSEVIMIDDADDKLLKEALAASRTGRLVMVGLKTPNLATLLKKVEAVSQAENLPILIIHQQLLAKNCPHCLKACAINESEELIAKYWPADKRYQPKYFFTSQGCAHCNYSGTKGQIASFNLLQFNNKKLDVLSTLAADALQKAANGLISISKYLVQPKPDSSKKL